MTRHTVVSPNERPRQGSRAREDTDFTSIPFAWDMFVLLALLCTVAHPVRSVIYENRSGHLSLDFDWRRPWAGSGDWHVKCSACSDDYTPMIRITPNPYNTGSHVVLDPGDKYGWFRIWHKYCNASHWRPFNVQKFWYRCESWMLGYYSYKVFANPKGFRISKFTRPSFAAPMAMGYGRDHTVWCTQLFNEDTRNITILPPSDLVGIDDGFNGVDFYRTQRWNTSSWVEEYYCQCKIGDVVSSQIMRNPYYNEGAKKPDSPTVESRNCKRSPGGNFIRPVELRLHGTNVSCKGESHVDWVNMTVTGAHGNVTYASQEEHWVSVYSKGFTMPGSHWVNITTFSGQVDGCGDNVTCCLTVMRCNATVCVSLNTTRNEDTCPVTMVPTTVTATQLPTIANATTPAINGTSRGITSETTYSSNTTSLRVGNSTVITTMVVTVVVTTIPDP